MTIEYAEAVRRRDELRDAIALMDRQHEERRAGLRASEARAADRGHEASRERVQADLDHAEARAAALGMLPADDVVSTRAHESRALLAGEYRDDQPLRDGQSVLGFVEARGQVPAEQRELSWGRYLRGWLTGDWSGADAERRAMSEGTATAGGHLVPTVLAAQVVDRARAATRVLQAGARTLPMSASTVKVPTVTGDPTLAFRNELATISPSDATLGAVTLTARTLAGRTLVSRELVEDAAPGIDTLVARLFGEQLALKVDAAALYGTGTAPEPLGLKSHGGVTKTSLGANGASPTWDNVVDSVFRVRTANYEPSAVIAAPRTAQSLGKLKDGSGAYLAPPAILDGLPRLTTTGVPVNLTVGTSTDTSDVFTGDWSQLVVGVRTSMEISLLKERSADVGAFEVLAWWRGDVAVVQPTAFDVVTGVRA